MIPRLRRRTILRLKYYAIVAGLWAVIGFFWELIEMGFITYAGVTVGLIVGVALLVMEESRLASFTQTMAFLPAVFLKSVVYLAVIAAAFIGTSVIAGLSMGLGWNDLVVEMSSVSFLAKMTITFSLYLGFIFFRHLNKLLGPGTLKRYLHGKYHHPRVERRAFMFLDLKSSTALAEKLGKEAYFSLLNTFFRDITEPIVEREAEIYQYIGDEVVLTWLLDDALRDANCVRVFIEIAATIHSHHAHYMENFGVVPEFKAGLHCGDVVTAEIGDLKKEIVYNGDVLNTTARIEGACNRFDRQLIASETLVSLIDLPVFIHPESLGAIELRGKAEPVSLIALV